MMVFARFLSVGFTIDAVVNQPDEKVVNSTLCIGLIVIQCYEVHQTA